jgi:hypothetical protein
LGVNKSLKKVQQRYYWPKARSDIEKVQHLCSQLWTRNWDQMHQYIVGALFERIAITVTEPFLQSDQGN